MRARWVLLCIGTALLISARAGAAVIVTTNMNGADAEVREDDVNPAGAGNAAGARGEALIRCGCFLGRRARRACPRRPSGSHPPGRRDPTTRSTPGSTRSGLAFGSARAAAAQAT